MTQFEKTVAYLEESAERDWKMAQKLFRSKDYSYCLFFCHLALEKLIKSVLVAKTDKAAPFTHNLARLAERAEIPLNKTTEENLVEISDFNVAGRYDDEKFAFYKKCTKPYTEKYFNITKDLILWLKKDYLKK